LSKIVKDLPLEGGSRVWGG